MFEKLTDKLRVSTHSRPKAAAHPVNYLPPMKLVSTHSRPKAADACKRFCNHFLNVSTHSRPKAAGELGLMACRTFLFQHTAARRRLVVWLNEFHGAVEFQHTAARRRLLGIPPFGFLRGVSTHSRPKAAEIRFLLDFFLRKFQHTAARRRLSG